MCKKTLVYTILLNGLILAATLMTGCRGEKPGSSNIKSVTASGIEAADPYLTKDHQGNPVLCWTEKEAAGGQYLLKYAIYDSISGEFGSAVSVTPSLGTKTSAESAGKVAFKSDGSIVALFGKRFEDPENRFASGIMYTLSGDRGESWSVPRYLHSDTLHRYGRGFFDICRLPNGEAGAIWLDGRFGEADTGSAIFFASTEKGRGFGPDKIIGESTCECCRTDILADPSGIIHVAYRDILYPSERFGKQVRDMVYSYSSDNGKNFSRPSRVSADNWEIEGCPHSGPSLASGPAGLQAVWFTAGGRPGVYQAVAAGKDRPFTPRKLLSAEARHPQMAVLPGGSTATVWEETTVKKEHNAEEAGREKSHEHAPGANEAAHSIPSGHSEHGSHSMHTGTETAAASVIILSVHSPEGEAKNLQLTDGKSPAHHAVLATLERPENARAGSLLVAWVEEENGVSGIKYKVVDF